MVADASTMFDVDTLVVGQTAALKVWGDLDVTSAPRLIAAVRNAIDPQVRAVQINCADIEFIDSAGVRALIVSRNESAPRGVDVRVVEPSAQVRRVLEMTGLSSILAL